MGEKVEERSEVSLLEIWVGSLLREGSGGAQRALGGLRGGGRRRVSPGFGAGDLLQPSSFQRFVKGSGEGVRVRAPRWDHDSVPTHRV